MDLDMVMANFTIRMVDCTMENGVLIRWREMVNCTISLVKLHTKDLGKMINSQEKVSFTINIQSLLTKTLIIEILMK